MKKLIFISLLISLTTNVFSQNVIDTYRVENLTAEEKNEFLLFEIPAIINGSNIDPSPISTVTLNLTDSKFSFKVGFPFNTNNGWDKVKKVTGFIGGDLIAKNGVSSVFKDNDFSYEGVINGGVSLMLQNRRWRFTNTDRFSSQALYWLSLRSSFTGGNYIFLDATKEPIMEKKRSDDFSGYISINRYFYSEAGWHRYVSVIWALGIGYSENNNYNVLDDFTYEKIQVKPTSNTTIVENVKYSKVGKVGEFRQYKGVSFFGEIYYPIRRKDTGLNLYYGTRYTRLNDKVIGYQRSVSTGLFFQAKRDDKTDLVDFSVSARWLRSTYLDTPTDKKFNVVIQASIPLRFN